MPNQNHNEKKRKAQWGTTSHPLEWLLSNTEIASTGEDVVIRNTYTLWVEV